MPDPIPPKPSATPRQVWGQRQDSPAPQGPAGLPAPPPPLAGDDFRVGLDTLLKPGVREIIDGAPTSDPAAPKDPRPVSPWIGDRIRRSVGAIFAQRRATVRRPSVARQPAWNPAAASQNGDGSLEPPRAASTNGAPAPGRGAVSPTGLVKGNSVMRFGENGDPKNFTILDQGSTNGCGTTSLAMMLNFHAGGEQKFDREKVDRDIRHYDMFTSPSDIAAYAERQGLEASVHSGTTTAELYRLVDQGLPVQVLLDVSDEHDGTGLHYEVVTGYGTGPDGKRYVELANPWGEREFMAEDVFLRQWRDLSAKGFPLGIDRVAIALKPAGHPAPLPEDDRKSFANTSLTGLRVAAGLTQVTSGWARGDASRVGEGVVRLLGCGLVAIPTLLANAAGRWGVSTIKEGRARLGNGFKETLLGAGQILGGGLAWAVSKPVEIVGNVASGLADLAATGVGKAFKAVGGLFS